MKNLKRFSGMGILALALLLALFTIACDQPLNYGKGKLEVIDGATCGFGWMPDQQQYFAARYMNYVFDYAKSPQPSVDQYEKRNDLVVASNHFIDPTVQASTGHIAIKDSVVRYNFLLGIVTEAIGAGGIDVAAAKNLVNYLSPLPTNPYGNDVIPNPNADAGSIFVGDYYKTKANCHGMRAVFDIGNMTMHVLFRKWDDPWVVYKW